jgi:hypothetical protein
MELYNPILSIHSTLMVKLVIYKIFAFQLRGKGEVQVVSYLHLALNTLSSYPGGDCQDHSKS